MENESERAKAEPTTGESVEKSNNSALAGFGQQLRQARLAAGISAREMARRVSVSPSFISQVELGRTRPSVGTLYSIASELGVPLDDLMPMVALFSSDEQAAAAPTVREQRGRTAPIPQHIVDDDPTSPVQRAYRRHELKMENAVWGRLTTDHDPANDFLHVVYSPGGQSCPADTLIHHRGREYGFVISGSLNVQVGSAHYELHPGDSISFESMTPHRLHNSSGFDCVSIWLVVGRGGTPVL